MPDNWGFVAAAYGLAFVVFGGYWRWLAQRERELSALRGDRAGRSHPLPSSAHPRPEPGPRAPLQ
jgi:hypothetical protein